MKFDRSSGILLHPTTLPGPYGIGDLSLNARKWIDFLGEAGCALWQVLPLGPTGYGDSPYQCFSAFAGNPYLISPDILHTDGFLDGDDIDFPPPFPPGHVDYGQVIQWKLSIQDRAYDHFQARATATLMAEYEKFQFEKASWLDDFALFMMLKDMHGGAAWVTWSEPYRKRDPQARDKAKQANSHIYNRQVFRQFLFFRQLHSLREYIADKGIKVIGDIPIFVAHDPTIEPVTVCAKQTGAAARVSMASSTAADTKPVRVCPFVAMLLSHPGSLDNIDRFCDSDTGQAG